jgi:type VI secretion system protein ImpA
MAETEQIVRTIADDVLKAIPGDRPAGIDSRTGKLWVELMKLRPRPSDGFYAGGESDGDSVPPDWPDFRDALETALSTKTKDLELGLFLAEANVRVHGFAGLRDAFWMLGGLITGFVSRGLHPHWEDGDLSAQSAKLHWLNEKLPDVISEVPLTRNPDAGPNYSLHYFEESRNGGGGLITASQFDEAAALGSIEEYRSLTALIEEAAAGLTAFTALVNDAYGAEAPSFSDAEACLEKCRKVVQGIVRRLDRNGKKDVSRVDHYPETASPIAFQPPLEGSGSSSPDAWSACEAMARGGNADSAIATMASLAASEPNGRVRFQRKLMLADLCLQTNRKKLGTSILEELDELIQLHKLDSWETSGVAGGVWARLVRCYRDKTAGTQNPARESEFFLKLSRLDPWQAVACGESRREE